MTQLPISARGHWLAVLAELAILGLDKRLICDHILLTEVGELLVLVLMLVLLLLEVVGAAKD